MGAAEFIAELCRQFPRAGHITLAKRLHAEYPAKYPTLNSANCAVRRVRGARGEKLRKTTKDKSQYRKASELPQLPKSEAKDWLPFVIPERRILIISDLHIPFHSRLAIDAALEFGDSFKPDAVLVNGDLFDFYHLSRFDKCPTLPKVSAELLAGGKFLDHLRARYPKAKLYFKLGNHDERWAKYLFAAAPLLSDIPEIVNGWQGPAGVLRNDVTVIDDQRPVMLGKLPVFHGHELGKSIFSPVNPARGAFLRAHHTIAVGHSHQTSGHADTNVWHEETFCWSFGCLCAMSPEYARINRWNWGFATVVVEEGGEFNVQNMRINKNGNVRLS